MSLHSAAICQGQSEHFTVESRSTPKPGPNDLLLEVKSVALNPADHIMRDIGLHITKYPTVIGFDVSGLVVEAGSNVPSGKSGNPIFQAGITRVAAYSAFAWRSSNADYGIFQERCLVPWQHAVPLPEETVSWNEAATLPVAVQVALRALDVLDIPWPRNFGDNTDKKDSGEKKNVLLVWGASASVGTMGVQIGRLLREDVESPFAAVYATAGAMNLEYVKSLGADRVFNYKDADVADAIVSAARKDGLVIHHCFLATGLPANCQAALKAFAWEGTQRRGKIASAAPLPSDIEQIDGVEAEFFMPPMDDEEKRLAHFGDIGLWLKESLSSKKIRPSPEHRIIGQGVEAIDPGLDELAMGVSCTKLVVEIGK